MEVTNIHSTSYRLEHGTVIKRVLANALHGEKKMSENCFSLQTLLRKKKIALNTYFMIIDH